MLLFSYFRSAGMRLAAPLTVAVVTLIALPFLTNTLAHYQALLVNVPYWLFAVVILLSQLFNQTRIGFVGIIMSCAYAVIINALQAPLTHDATKLIYCLLAGLLPFNLLQVHLMPERRLLSPFGVLFLGFLALQFGWAVLVYNHFKGMDLTAWWETYFFTYRNISPLPLILLLLNLALVCSSASTLLKRNRHADQTIFIGLLFGLLTLSCFDYPYISSVSFSVVATLLLINITFSSHELAFVDQLTQIPGRRALDHELKHLGNCYTLAMIDIDHFKKINDKYGHDTGDDVLKLVAKLLNEIGFGGKAYRYGGEEFTIVFKGKTLEQCLPHLETLRDNMANYKMTLRDTEHRPNENHQGIKKRGQGQKSKTLKITISIGVAENYLEPDPKNVLTCADTALYNAKNAGRNRIQSAS